MFPVAPVARAAGEATAHPNSLAGFSPVWLSHKSSAVVISLGILVPSSISPTSHISSQFVPLFAVLAPLPHSGAPARGTRKQPPSSPHSCSSHRSCLSGLAHVIHPKALVRPCSFPAKAPSLVVVATGFIVHTLHSAPRVPSSCCLPP